MSARSRFRPRACELGDVEPHAALGRLASHRLPILLDSAGGEPRRWSVLAFDPLRSTVGAARDVLELRDALRELDLERGDDVPGPFHGGLMCALAYDLGAHGERPVSCASEPFGFPRIVGGLYVDFLVRDEGARTTWLVLGDQPGDGRPGLEQRRARVLAELEREAPRSTLRAGALRRDVSSAEHMARIERCRAHISVGDIYQANLAHRLRCDLEGEPHDWYACLRAANPAPYMAYARWDEDDGFAPAGAVLSASPELLVEFDGREARTRPIKGTSARSDDEHEDARRRAELLASAKERAELAMIVDLERNDLARVATPGGVWVEGFPRLASYARVHHLLADVVAQVRPGVDAFDLLAALFPGGSITGAPKLRAMEIIAELEGVERGFFSGSLGFVDTRGRAAFNILIRSALWRPRAAGGELSLRFGGGITWSSDPAAEDRETLAKAAGWIAALAAGGGVASDSRRR